MKPNLLLSCPVAVRHGTARRQRVRTQLSRRPDGGGLRTGVVGRLGPDDRHLRRTVGRRAMGQRAI